MLSLFSNETKYLYSKATDTDVDTIVLSVCPLTAFVHH